MCLSFLLCSNAFASSFAYLEALYTKNNNAFIEEVRELASDKDNFNEAQLQSFYYYEGLSYILSGELDIAKVSLTKAIGTKNKVLKFKAITSLINIVYAQGDFRDAFKLGLELSSDEYVDVEHNVRARGLIVIASSLAESGLVQEAFNLIESIESTSLNAKTGCLLTSLVGQLAQRSGLFVLPLEQVISRKDYCLTNEEYLYAYLTEWQIARILMNNGKYAQAKTLLENNVDDVMSYGYLSLTAGWLATLAELYAEQGEYRLSGQYALRARELESSFGITSALPAYASLARAYQIIGDTTNAYNIMLSYQTAYEKAYQRNLSAAVAYHAATLQAAQRQQEIALLSKEKEVLQLDNALSKTEAENTRLYLAVTVAVIALLIVLMLRSQRSQVRLKKRITFDKLTQVYSRDYFEDLMTATLSQAKRKHDEMGVVLFDLDKFKNVNDTYGHQVGDWVLERTAYIAKQVLRKHDAVGRLGGEEFAILLPGCDAERSRHIADAVRQAIARIDTTECGENFDISASFGVTTTKHSGYNQRVLLADADKALYASKHNGRNQVTVAIP